MSGDALALPAIRIEALIATRACSDDELVACWLTSLKSAHSRRNFAMTAQRFLAALPMGLRAATLEDVRDAIVVATAGAGAAKRQYPARQAAPEVAADPLRKEIGHAITAPRQIVPLLMPNSCHRSKTCPAPPSEALPQTDEVYP